MLTLKYTGCVYLFSACSFLLSCYMFINSSSQGLVSNETWPEKVTIFNYRKLEQFKYNNLLYYTSGVTPVRETTRVLILVAARPDSIELRNTIRNTWGHDRNLVQYYTPEERVDPINKQLSPKDAKVEFNVNFVVGIVEPRIQAMIDNEIAEKKDIIQGDFPEGYYNLSLKTNFILQHANRYNSRLSESSNPVHFLVKVDDDTFINMRLLGAVLSQTVSHKAYGGVCGSFDLPKRETKSKFFVSMTQYPYKFYPPHCQGPMYYLSSDLVEKTSELSKSFHSLFQNGQRHLQTLARFEDILVGYYLFLSSKPLLNVNQLDSRRVIPYFNLVNLQLQRVPSRDMFAYGDYSCPSSAANGAPALDKERSVPSRSSFSRAQLGKHSFKNFFYTFQAANASLSHKGRNRCRDRFEHAKNILAYHHVNVNSMQFINTCLS